MRFGGVMDVLRRGPPDETRQRTGTSAPQGDRFRPFSFILSLRNGNLWLRVHAPKDGAACTVSKNRYHAREAAAALLKMAKATSDPAVAVGLIEAASKLKDEAGELSPPVTVQPPDVYPDDVQPKED